MHSMGRTVILCSTRLAISLVFAMVFLQLCGKPGLKGLCISLSIPLLPAGLALLDQILNFTWYVAVRTPNALQGKRSK